MMLYIFIHGLTGRVFKVLPLMEETLAGHDVHLDEYLDSCVLDMMGALDTFPELQGFAEYVTILNIVQYMAHNNMTQETCKREVFKALGLLNAIERKLGGDCDA